MRYRALFIGASLIAGMLAAPVAPVAAQSATCPIVGNAVVAGVMGGPVITQVSNTVVQGIDSCDFFDSSGTDYAVSRETNAFQAGEATSASALAAKFLPDLSSDAQNQLSGLAQAGQTVSIPGYDLMSVSGIGDSALWIKAQSDSGTDDTLLVQKGNDVLAFDTNDSPNAQSRLSALAQAVLTGS